MSFVRANFASGTLSVALTLGGVTMTVVASHTLPTVAGNMRLTIWDADTYADPADDPSVEIVTAVYSGTSNIYTITRAQEVTSASTHAVGSKVALSQTAAVSLENYPRRVAQASIPVSGTADDEIDVGEWVIWMDTDDASVRIVYNDESSGIVSILLT